MAARKGLPWQSSAGTRLVWKGGWKEPSAGAAREREQGRSGGNRSRQCGPGGPEVSQGTSFNETLLEHADRKPYVGKVEGSPLTRKTGRILQNGSGTSWANENPT